MNSNEVLEFESLIYNSINFDLTKVDFDINYEQKETLRESNSKVMNIISNSIWNFVGGNADTSSSTLAYLNGKEDISYSNFKGKNILYGVRENAEQLVMDLHYQDFYHLLQHLWHFQII